MHVFRAALQPYFFRVPRSPKSFVSHVTDALRARREALGWSHETVAQRAGLHRSTVSRVEAKKINPTLYVLRSIADALDLRFSDVCREAEESDER